MKGRPAQAPLSSLFDKLPQSPDGGFIVMDGEEHYRISSYHRISPFLMSLASDTDLWMSVTSRGGLTAGRVDPDGSLFPYLTVDQLHDAHHHTGPVTLIRIERGDAAPIIWEPFSETATESYLIKRYLYKNAIGSRLIFEEVNEDLGLTFRYCWSGCDEFGWVRTSTVENRGAVRLRISILDGLRNILPYGAPLSLYQQASNLVDAYKKTEVDAESGLGIFSLTGGITDRAEALEVLKANTVWFCGLEDYHVHLSLESVSSFRHGHTVAGKNVLNGTRGNYLVTSTLDLDVAESSRWHLVADVGRDHSQIAELRRDLRGGTDLVSRIQDSLEQASENLSRNVGSADGIQLSGDPESAGHHFANVLFNNMRGGVFAHNYDLPVADFGDHLQIRNRAVALRQGPILEKLPPTIRVEELRELARESGDHEFERLCFEYLPLHFGRRHGDPSRPWNRFTIRTRDEAGERVLHYEGNWRDIFQNWEALCTAFPGFLPNVIAKFVNASTVDGFNPYRISRSGVDWETVEPNSPWNNIGYWGDHQIVYLLKLLERMSQYDPTALEDLLGREIFSYAEVPYVIKSYQDILRDPQTTIEFDSALASRIDLRVTHRGTDGKLLTDPEGAVYHVNLMEKLLVPALAKLSNLIPDAGIWMNTQRPEWNDANNALGGGGVSMVTLCYLRRYLAFLVDLFDGLPEMSQSLSKEVAVWFGEIETILQSERQLLVNDHLTPHDRKRLLDALGGAFSTYREAVYAEGFSGKSEVSARRVSGLCRTALEYVSWGIKANKREDGLYHSYNLLEFTADGSGVEVAHLEEMLEGQVAVLSSGLPDPEEALQILEQLFTSDLYRPDQHSFMLYPERKLPGFLAKNMIPEEAALAIPLVNTLLATGDQAILSRDVAGACRFHSSLSNARDLAAKLDDLAANGKWTDLVARDRGAILELFEDVFNHKSYTGRSGVMYGYEGLGCIYWHMVAKLLLAVQEVTLHATDGDSPPAVQTALAEHYFRIRSGFGFEKSVAEYGAFPTDPYSHTPPGGGAKQPGMTGHVKEVILTRIGELGIRVEAGEIRFQPVLLHTDEFLKQPGDFRYHDLNGNSQTLTLAADSLAFTFCQVPVIYVRGEAGPRIDIVLSDGTESQHEGNTLNPSLSGELFARSGMIARIRVEIPDQATS